MILEGPITERAMLEAFALAEATSHKGALALAIREAPVTNPLAAKIRRGLIDELSTNERDVLTHAIQQTRCPLLAGLVGQPIAWVKALLSADEILSMRFLAVSEWLAKWPSQRLADLCGLRHIEGHAREFQGRIHEDMRPIALGPDASDLCLVEGYTRCCTLLRDVRAGLAEAEAVPFIVGLWPEVGLWASPTGHRWYGD